LPQALTPPLVWSGVEGLAGRLGLAAPAEGAVLSISEVPEALLIADAGGRITAANERAHRLLEREPGELIGLPLEVAFRLSESRGPERRELLGVRGSGTFLAEASVGVGDDRVVVLVRDVTVQREAARGSHEDERRLRLVVEAAEIGTWLVDVQRSMAFWDDRLHRMFGMAPGTFGGTFEAFLQRVHPDDAAHVADTAMRAMQSGEPCALDFRAVLPDGRIRHLAAKTDVVRDDSGQPTRVMGVCTDVTERVLARERLQRAHDQLERRVEARTEELKRSLKELDDFAHIISHDLKEPLRGIFNYAKFVADDYKAVLPEEACLKLERISHLAKHMDALIESILDIARLGRVDLEIGDCDLNGVVADVVTSLDPMIREHGVKIRINGPLPSVACHPHHVANVFRNLLTNAIKYNDKPEKTVEIGSVSMDTHIGPVLYVRDNGIGIEDQYFDSIFAMFKRLHPRDAFGGGTGAGLAIVRKLVQLHGGVVWAESKPGEGSTFYFTLGGHVGNGHARDSASSRERAANQMEGR
jgi:PAS domain S-box-containing protein